ncbi:MAG TPA: hypothetical protein VF708_08940 [Pyrinomonadaceae bacterium]
MPSKKNAPKKRKSGEVKQQGENDIQISRFHGVEEAVFPLPSGRNGKGDKQPVYLNPETNEDREKRLAARKALTLKAFKMAYENRRRRKAS